jgi:hypothetical protein
MKNYRDSNPNRIDNILCALVVVMVLGSVGYSAFVPMLAWIAKPLSA